MPEVLAICFGAVIGLLIVLGIGYLVLRKMSSSQRAREHSFRQGHHRDASQPALLPSSRSVTLASEPLSPGVESSARSGTMVNVGSNGEPVKQINNSKPLAFLSNAPPFHIPGLGRAHKGDADSLRTDFLQV